MIQAIHIVFDTSGEILYIRIVDRMYSSSTWCNDPVVLTGCTHHLMVRDTIFVLQYSRLRLIGPLLAGPE